MNEYRVTRPDLYVEDTGGIQYEGEGVESRQGHYILAETENEARRIAHKSFQKDTHFDIQLFKKNFPY